MHRLISLLYLSVAYVAPALSQPAPTAIASGANAETTPSTVLEAVLVSGEQPGPGLWKVSKPTDSGEHVVWIFGDHAPLPEKMLWRSREVERIIAKSQQVIAWPQIETEVETGFFAKLAALPSLAGVAKNPSGATLKDLLPSDLYALWSTLKGKYLGASANTERLRPIFAAEVLRYGAIAKEGLSDQPATWQTIRRLARKHHVKVDEPEITIHVQIENPRAVLKRFNKIHLDDHECFAESLAQLETELPLMKVRANAWALGDIEKLRAYPVNVEADCTQLLLQAALSGKLVAEVGGQDLAEHARRELTDALKAQHDVWLQAVEDALATQQSTLATAPVSALLNPHGPLAVLRERGYVVTEP